MKVYKYRNYAGYCCHKGHAKNDKRKCRTKGCPFADKCIIDTNKTFEVKG